MGGGGAVCGHEGPVDWDREHAGASRWRRARRCVRCRRTRFDGAARRCVDARRDRGTSQAGRRPDQGAILPEDPPRPKDPAHIPRRPVRGLPGRAPGG
ncbi:hypothetical protein HMPREF1129_0020 [Actinomyces naeslundii str. Howell 279]|uniref:Uncharacterized protein n=1 Tax=Actinomyces naeslundii (strain ATCC 12104 / DSM 43013 / CCUG 2238 / JCM 8349 / NCTC 10301 / Howell 279) TaxID=1115803 RepID=J3F421_ACTNH|nr:hypothetical protein HMPREF1129_0020 [Actinomyces naeslundii str. Howell 279]